MQFSAFYDVDQAWRDDHWVVVACSGRLLIRGQQFFHCFRQLQLPSGHVKGRLPLGTISDRPCFLLIMDDDAQVEGFSSLRAILREVGEEAFAFAGRALQLQYWWDQHRFCGRCGHQTVMHHRECAKVCAQCANVYYPRIYPCVIGLISRGRECLLALHTRSKSGYYSLLAGFVEPGETLEQGMCREIYEEVGIHVQNIRYVASQSWPFPSQLMVGFHAEYAAGEITVDGEEIEHAQWFSPERIPSIPPEGTLSGRLIREHLQRTSGPNLVQC